MSSTHLANMGIYRRVARRLAERGFPRTAEQCRSKFKKIRCDFMASLEAWQGVPRLSGQIMFHSQMMRLWEEAGRPRWEERRHLGKSG